MGLAFFILLRAYANGGSSLTGLEAISNGVASFRGPSARNARKTLVLMSCVLGFLLARHHAARHWTHAFPYFSGYPTVVAQEVRAVFGNSGVRSRVYYLVILFATVLILYTGGNTSFNGFPFLANYVASDQYLPRQLTKRGHRLAFSNGILVLGVVSLSLIIVFNAKVNALGRPLRDRRLHRLHHGRARAWWRATCATHGQVAPGGVHQRDLGGGDRRSWCSSSSSSKFTEGAWIIVVVGPLMYMALIRFNKQYEREEQAFECERHRARRHIRTNRVVIFVDHYDLATERALQYCNTLNAYSIRAVHFDIDPLVTKRLERRWGAPDTASASISLEIVECEDRRLDRAALELVADVVRDPDVFCMVILPRKGFVSRLQRLLHDRTADAIAGAVMHVPRTAATIIPYRSVDASRRRRRPRGAAERRGRARWRARGFAPRGRRQAGRAIGRRDAHRWPARAQSSPRSPGEYVR